MRTDKGPWNYETSSSTMDGLSWKSSTKRRARKPRMATKKKTGILTFEEYAAEAAKFRLATADEFYVVLNLIGEVGELYSKWAKSVRDGTEPTESEIKHELGDILWMLSAMCHDMGTSLGEVASMNLIKLDKRASKKTLQGSGDNR
jgi:NTP pyrophosphatase (non-canonical NTP hydrolase)